MPHACFAAILHQEQKQPKIKSKIFLALIHSAQLKMVEKYQFTSVLSVVMKRLYSTMIQEKHFAFLAITRAKQKILCFVIGVENRMNVMVTMELGCVLTV